MDEVRLVEMACASGEAAQSIGPEWVAELPRVGGHGDHAVVRVLGRLDVDAGADAERRPRG